MNKQHISEPSMEHTSQRNIIRGMIILNSLLTVGLIWGGIYMWQQSYFVPDTGNDEASIALLQDEIDALQSENDTLRRAESLNIRKELSDVTLPVVVYSRAGLLNNTQEGKAEREQLEQKFVEPFIDYHNDNGTTPLTISISVPQKTGESYTIKAIFPDGVSSGFFFGERERDYDYWKPLCMGPCSYSDTFREKYPEIVAE